MARVTDVRPIAAAVYLHPITTRVPLKFGTEVLTDVQVAHVELHVVDRRGRRACGIGETPLNVQWAWPSATPYADRLAVMTRLCAALTRAWAEADLWGHPIEIGSAFDREVLAGLQPSGVPRLAALVCNSAFDLALHDAYGRLHDVDVYATYGAGWMNHDLAWHFADDPNADRFRGRYPGDFLVRPDAVPTRLPVWHLVGGLDAIDAADLTGDEPVDGHPVLLRDWIHRDGLRCLKIKLRGSDPAWDYARLVRVGEVALECGVPHLCADFNCTVTDPAVVEATIDRLQRDEPAIAGRLLYVEQPFPYELEDDRLDVRALASRVPLLLDESAHDWRHVRLGHGLGWSGVALKTCKTQSGALLSHCWARAHDMQIMVQDLTNPMLAMIPHVRLAAHAGTIKGVECNAAQFYPEGSAAEARVHPGLYARRDGVVDLSTIAGQGFGYRDEEVGRVWRDPLAHAGE
jgi:L-alanine-DL-glutamate epimerase-like enolase superfamily enzyme